MYYKQHKSFWLNLELTGKIRKNIFTHLNENISEFPSTPEANAVARKLKKILKDYNLKRKEQHWKIPRKSSTQYLLSPA